MNLTKLQLSQLQVSQSAESVRVSRVPGPMHGIITTIAFTHAQRAGLAALCGLA